SNRCNPTNTPPKTPLTSEVAMLKPVTTSTTRDAAKYCGGILSLPTMSVANTTEVQKAIRPADEKMSIADEATLLALPCAACEWNLATYRVTAPRTPKSKSPR